MAGTIETRLPAKQITISAVVTRANGSSQDLGIVSYYHRNPLMRLRWWLRQLFKGRQP